MRTEESVAPPREERIHGRHAALVILLSLLLHAPSLGWGFFADDHGHELVLDGALDEYGLRPWALYEFGVLSDNLELRTSEGTFPFWTGDDWRAQFLRPLSSLARWAEHVAFDGEPFGAHVVGLLWWAAFLALAWRLFLALGLAPRAALWALALLGLENGAALTVGWLANRNSVVEGVFLLSALLLFVRGAQAGARGRITAAFLCAGCATLSKESGVAAFALIAAWCWLGRRAAASSAFERGRARWATCAVGLALAYLGAYVALGYGTRSTFYPTPWSEPAAWLARLGLALPGGVIAMTTPLMTDPVHVVQGLAPLIVAGGLVIALVLGRTVAPSARAHAAGTFLVVWILLTLTPQASAPLSDRLFLVPMVGAAGCLGIFLEATRLRVREGWARGPERVAAGAVIASGIALSGLALGGTSLSMLAISRFARDAILQAEVGPASLGQREAIVLQSPSQLVSLQPTAARVNLTGDEEVRFWLLSATRRGVRWTRTGERSFELEALDEPFLSSLFEGVFLTREPAFEEGHEWTTDLFSVRGHDVELGRPRRLEVELDRPLDAPELRFLAWRPAEAGAKGFGTWIHVPPPSIGESITFPERAAPLPFLP